MGFALITHPARFRPTWTGLLAPMEIPESKIGLAVAQGWIVIARDSDVYAPVVEVPAQSNPRRQVHGYGAVRDTGEDET